MQMEAVVQTTEVGLVVQACVALHLDGVGQARLIVVILIANGSTESVTPVRRQQELRPLTMLDPPSEMSRMSMTYTVV